MYHNVAQVPLAKDPACSGPSTSTAPRSCSPPAADAGVAKVVHTSSSAVFGVPETNPVLPTTVPKPQEAYGHAKLAAEWACLRAAAGGLDVTIVRPRTILGHGRLGIFGILFDWIADGADPIVLGDGANRYQFVHADDLAEVCLRGRRPVRSRPSSTPAPTASARWRDALGHLCEHAGTGARVRSPPGRAHRGGDAGQRRAPPDPVRPLPLADVRPVDVVRPRPRPATQLGWTPRWSTDEMLAQSYDWFVAHRAEPATGRTGENGTSPHRRTARAGALGALKRAHRVAASGPLMALVETASSARRVAGRRRPGPARVRPGPGLVARADAGRHQALPLPRTRAA